MWIEKVADEECLRTWIRNCPALKLVSTLDGEILWANESFCNWSQYTLGELKRKTWMSISVDDANLQADMEEVKSLDSYSPIYKVKKQYIPKGSDPEWGVLTVMRYPLNGEIQFCLCTWEPVKHFANTAFEVAIKSSEKVERRIAEMSDVLKVLTAQTEEDRYVLSTINMIKKHPKIAAAFVVIALGMFGLNNTLEFLQRTGIIEIPIRVEAVEPKAETGDINQHANDIAKHY